MEPITDLLLLWGPTFQLKLWVWQPSSNSVVHQCDSCQIKASFEYPLSMHFKQNVIPHSSHISPKCGKAWVNLSYPLNFSLAQLTHPSVLYPEHTLAPAEQHASLNLDFFGDFTIVWVCSFFQYLLYLHCICSLYKHSGFFFLNFHRLLIFIMIIVKHGKFLVFFNFHC